MYLLSAISLISIFFLPGLHTDMLGLPVRHFIQQKLVWLQVMDKEGLFYGKCLTARGILHNHSGLYGEAPPKRGTWYAKGVPFSNKGIRQG